MKKYFYTIINILITVTAYSVPVFLKNENAIITLKEKFTTSLEAKNIQRYGQEKSIYNTLCFSLKGTFTPNNSIEVGFEIPYFKIVETTDSGIIGDISLFSKFLMVNEIFSLVDNFLLQGVTVLNISLATGIKKEDGYRNIGIQKGIYYPLSSGYADIEIGTAFSLIGTVFGLSGYFCFTSVSSKIEPPLAFNTENDHFVLGSTFEIFMLYSQNFTLKSFSEITYYLPISEKSKYINIFLVGSGIWSRIYETVVVKLGYYKNLSAPIDIEKHLDNIILVGIGFRF
ncbi:MAG: hypothetical protein N2712_07675 [Brevinematales bacterium]|nr:hypothetical protein [Brevinematales bacterium]